MEAVAVHTSCAFNIAQDSNAIQLIDKANHCCRKSDWTWFSLNNTEITVTVSVVTCAVFMGQGEGLPKGKLV